MIRHAFWLLEQESRALERNTGRPFSETWRDIPISSKWVMAGLGIGQSAVVSSLPYVGLIRAGGFAEDYVWARTAPQWAIKEFRFGPGIKGVQAIGWSTSRRSMMKLAAMKVASRFIPYVGWGLLAYDLYSVGKWAHGKYS